MTGLVARSRLENALEDVEQRTLGELEFLREPLRQSVHAAITCDCELAMLLPLNARVRRPERRR